MSKSIFKKSVLGYSPTDVSNYIEKINAQAANEIENIERKIGKIRDEKDVLSAKISELENALDAASEYEKQIDGLKKIQESLEWEIAKTKEELGKSESHCEKLQSEYDALNIRYTSAFENSQSYEKTCRDAGNILLIAQSKAEEVENEAKKNAEIIIANAKINAEEIVSKATAEAKHYLAKTKAEADSYSVKVRTEADLHVEQTKEKVDFLIKRQKQLFAALQNQKSEIAKFYEETVSGLGGNGSGSSK